MRASRALKLTVQQRLGFEITLARARIERAYKRMQDDLHAFGKYPDTTMSWSSTASRLTSTRPSANCAALFMTARKPASEPPRVFRVSLARPRLAGREPCAGQKVRRCLWPLRALRDQKGHDEGKFTMSEALMYALISLPVVAFLLAELIWRINE